MLRNIKNLLGLKSLPGGGNSADAATPGNEKSAVEKTLDFLKTIRPASTLELNLPYLFLVEHPRQLNEVERELSELDRELTELKTEQADVRAALAGQEN
jgi:hypothetical protein